MDSQQIPPNETEALLYFLKAKGISLVVYRALMKYFNIQYVRRDYIKLIPNTDVIDINPYALYYLSFMDSKGNYDIVCGFDEKVFGWARLLGQKFHSVIRACDWVNENHKREFGTFEEEIKRLPNEIIHQFEHRKRWAIGKFSIGVDTHYASLFGNAFIKGIYENKIKNTQPYYDMKRTIIRREYNKRDFDGLQKYLIDNNISHIFKKMENCLVEINDNKIFLTDKCIVDGHNLNDIANYRPIDTNTYSHVSILPFFHYDKNAIIASYYFKSELESIQKALEVCGPELCEILMNYVGITIQSKKTFMCVNKYFNELIRNANVKFEKDVRVGCVNGCGNEIMILKDSIMSSLPECIACTDPLCKIYGKGKMVEPGNWARCSEDDCKCLFWVPKDNNPYLGKNPLCEICVNYQ